jgi:4-hydroxybenzoate polyprenyltransferase
MNMGREVYKTIEDALGDKAANITTIAVRFGVFKTRILGALFVIASVALSVYPYITGQADVVYLGFVIIADIVFVAAVAAPMRYSSKFIKIGMNIAMLAFLLGAYSIQGLF